MTYHYKCFGKIIKLIMYKEKNQMLDFWLKRFCPNVSIISKFMEKDTVDIVVDVIKCDKYNYKINKNYIKLYGILENYESYLAKFITQLFQKILIEDNILIIPSACVSDGKRCILIIGDFWQGKTSVAINMSKKYNLQLISDNYVAIKDSKVIASTSYISTREEDSGNEYKTIHTVNNRNFCENKYYSEFDELYIVGVLLPFINSSDNNIHIISDEESKWYLYQKFCRLLCGETVLFNGNLPSPNFLDKSNSIKILNITNKILENNHIKYVSTNMNNILLEGYKMLKETQNIPNKEYNFVVKLTTSCPGNCKCCKNRQENFKYKNNKTDIFDIDVFEKICRNIKKMNGSYVCLSGGEPTLIKNISSYIKIANNYGLSTRINTNGWNVTEDNLKCWLENGLDQIVVSIYGLDKNLVGEIRGNSTIFDKSILAINTIKKLKKKYKFIFILQTVILKNNYKQLPKILEFAIKNNADLLWPSYLEDAINLPDIRMNENDIKDFKENIIPEMKDIVISKIKDKTISNNIIKSLDIYYNDGADTFNYHKKGENCHWAGKHFTFYPNGVIDPCPEHEYFKSEYQHKINYRDIDSFMSIDNLNHCSNICFEYCKYCPQGIHHQISFMPIEFNEHDTKEVLK